MTHNKLSGEVLPVSTNFTDILVLLMDSNQFTGKIGEGLRKLQGLSLLDISNNSLTESQVLFQVGSVNFIY